VDPVAKILFEYLRNVLYNPARTALDMESLPPGFRDLGEGLKYLAECIFETKKFAQALSKGNLDAPFPSPGNEMAAPLKSLHSSLQHLSWQTQQVAQGDYQQRVAFMGNFSTAFNSMIEQLEERRKVNADEQFKLQQYVNLLLSNSPEIILLFDIDGKLVFTSESYMRCSNIEEPGIIQNASFRELFRSVASDDFLQRMDGLLQEAIADKRSSEIAQEIAFGNDDNIRSYLIQITPMQDKKERVVGTLLFFHDTTESIRAQQAAEHARELAEQSARVKSEFLARMSHEMRTPMNAILGMTTIAKGADDPERKTYCLDRIHDAARHLLGLINDILDMSTLEADSFALSLDEFNFANMVQHVSDSLKFHVEKQKQTLSIDIDSNVPAHIISDEQRLAQILTNLLSNAVKFTPEHGSISLTAKKIAEQDGICTLRFIVKDTGIGISVEQQKRLFVLFEQADGGFSRKFGGTGLGLAIAKRIIDMMDGCIWVESELGGGSAFFFEIKVKVGVQQEAFPPGAFAMRADTAPQSTETQDYAQSGASHAEPLAGKHILVAEDVDINREIVSSLLEDTGVKLVFAFDGADALAKFSAAPDAYDLILMDIHMPNVDGYEATRRIRSSGLPGADAIPIIAMTANVFREDIERCLAAGMNSHLGKPIDFGLLTAELKKYLV
jgi:signal transduction histidine kinase/CheY-like chemotaxis protein